ncbi:MAG: hypothetical protein AB7I25_01440 [Vicinamibacterales bacterium]
MNPYVSLLLTGRNDGYGVDFNDRFLRTLEFNVRELRARQIPFEVVLIEWAPPEDRPLLADLVSEQLPGVSDVLTTYVVDAQYQEAMSQNPHLWYLEFVAKNVGLRRVRGEFVLSTNADVYVSRGILDALAARTLRPATLYRALRVDVKLGVDHTHVGWDLLEDERNQLTGQPMRPPLFPGGTGDFLLLDRDTFLKVKGFNEVYRRARVGVDYNFLVKFYGSGYPIVDIGHPVYHIAHVGGYRPSKSLYRDHPEKAHYGDHRWPSHAVVYDNHDDWGLVDAPTVPVRPGVFRIPFDWSVVPPIVDLRRVLLAGARVGRGEL